MKVTAWQREKYILLGTDFGYFVGFQEIPVLDKSICYLKGGAISPGDLLTSFEGPRNSAMYVSLETPGMVLFRLTP
jgi:hypothetical protein